jgi:hypothetical protein
MTTSIVLAPLGSAAFASGFRERISVTCRQVRQIAVFATRHKPNR